MNDCTTPETRRILVIDDNPAIHGDFRKIFRAGPADEKAPAFTIDSANQGRDGLAMVETAIVLGRPYAMAFVDVRMSPEWDTIETIARLWEVSPDLQVVICTAFSDNALDDMIEKLGASDQLVILKKPFETIEVLQLANALT